jgi:alkyl sulfatase BDS1-like metallo-beta-lactamase superfamily hydrolase
VAAFLSDAWIAALDDAARHIEGGGEPLVIQQVVTDGDGEVTWHVALGPDGVRVRPGRADAADVTFTQDRETAEAIARGELSAATALTAGQLVVQGAAARLVDHRAVLARLDEALHA